MLYDIAAMERKVLADKWAGGVITTETVYGNYYRRVRADWFNYDDNKLKLNDLWHSFVICEGDPHYTILVVKNVGGTLTFNGIKNYQAFRKYARNTTMLYKCLYNMWSDGPRKDLADIIKFPRRHFIKTYELLIEEVMREQV